MDTEAYCGNTIYIKNATQDMINWCYQNLTVANPDYYKKLNMGKYVGNVPERIYLYEIKGDSLVLPFGVFRRFYRLFHGECCFKPEFADFRHERYKSSIELYPYQNKALNKALDYKNGILVMPCGSGKTILGLNIIAKLGGRALWLTHTQDLLNQSMKSAKKILICESKHPYGTITGGKSDIGTHITFATVQTMCKMDLTRYKDYFDIIIVDECQHCCGSPTRVTQFYKVVNSLSARYKIGLTATPKRADGLELGMFALLGDIIHEVTREEVAEKTCDIKIQPIYTGYMPDENNILNPDGTIDYAKVIDDLIHDDDRYNIVFGDILTVARSGATMILANRVEYLQRIHDDLIGCGVKSVMLSGQGQSKKVKQQRKEALEKLNDGEIDCILGTYILAKEGLDVPNLRYVVFATPEKDETTVIQSTGRVGRSACGKEYGTVIDFVDDFGMYIGWWKKRKGYYRKIGAEVVG